MPSTAAPPDAPSLPNAEDAPSERGRARWHTRLAVHLLAYGLLLVAVMATGPIGTWTSDDGAYAIEAITYDDTGGFALGYPLIESDPDGDHFGFVNSERAGDRWYTSAKHPAWVVVVTGAYLLGGDAALFVPCLLGAMAAAAAAWSLARQSDHRWSVPAFWLVALGPLAAQSTGLWAHAPSAALAGWATVALVLLIRRGPSPGRLVGLSAALAAGIFLRSEGLLFAAAVVAALAGFEWCTHRGLARAGAALRTVALPSLAVVVAYLLDGRWRATFAPGLVDGIAPSTSGSAGWLDGRLSGAVHSLLRGGDQPRTHLLGLVGLAACLAGAVVLRARSAAVPVDGSSDRPSAVVPASGLDRLWPFGLLLVGLAVLAVRYLLFAREPIMGLAPAWPLAMIGLVLWRWTAAEAWERVMVVAAALFSGAILVTQYPEGGGLDWGGRFFAPMAVPIAVLAVAGIARLLAGRPIADQSDVMRTVGDRDRDREHAPTPIEGRETPGRDVGAVPVRPAAGSPGGRQLERPLLVLAVVLGLLVPAGAAAVATESLRGSQASVVATIADAHPETVISLEPQLGRIAWRTVPEIAWLNAEDVADAQQVLTTLDRLGERRVAVFGNGLDGFSVPGWRTTRVSRQLIVLERTDG